MAEVQFDIALKNNGSGTEALTLFSPVMAQSQLANKYAFSTPYSSNYPSGTVFTITDDAGNSTITLDTPMTMAQVILMLNALNIGTFMIAYNDNLNGNVFHLLSVRNPSKMSIVGAVVIVGAFQLVSALSGRDDSSSDCSFGAGSTIIISGTSGKIFVSNNDGDTWATQTLPNAGIGWNICQISYTSAGNCYYVVGNDGTDSKIWTSATGGIGTWTEVQTYLNARLYGLKMFDLNNGIVFGFHSGGIRVLSTNDGCNTLSSVQVIGSSQVGRIQFVDSNNGFIFIHNAAQYLYTTNGGASWTAVVPPFLSTDGYAINANEIVFVGQSGVVYKTPNNGGSWVDISITTSNDLFNVYAFEYTGRIMVGRQGKQWTKSTNGGTSWTNNVLGPGGIFTKVYFKNDSIGIAFTDGEIYQYY